jgi:hypothetical protein
MAQSKKGAEIGELQRRIDEKIARLQERKRAVAARERERERKARHRRLLRYGEIAERVLDCAGAEPEEFERMLAEAVGRTGGGGGAPGR